MASKSGTRPKGTDGNDFTHREKIASQYQQSADYKRSLKQVALTHCILWLVLVFRLAVPICRYLSLTPPSFLVQLRLPKAESWEMMWLPSIISNLFVLTAIRNNRAAFLFQYMLGQVVFGFVPLAFAVATHKSEFMMFWQTRKVTSFTMGYPTPVLRGAFLLVAASVHLYALFYAFRLRALWSTRSKSKAN